MTSNRATVVDYGMGNVRSLVRALERVGATVEVTDDPRVVEAADRIAIPGQGAFGQAMDRLNEAGLVEAITAAAEDDRPVLGVCLGLQIMFDRSEEAPDRRGLGIVEASVDLLPVGDGLKRPHMGWAPVVTASDHPVLAANPSGAAFYFVHSYAARSAPAFEAATVTHGVEVIAAIAKDALVATQFHPEKSQDAGERLLAAWMAL